MGGRGPCAALLLLAGLALASDSGLLSSSSLIPRELLEYFHPLVRDEARVLPGVVERRRRSTLPGEEEEDEVTISEEEAAIRRKEQKVDDAVNTFNITKKFVDSAGVQQEEKCLFIRTRAVFTINFETRPGAPIAVASKTYTLPNKDAEQGPTSPDKVNGTCALETETSMIFIFWSGFNFTIEFTKNPEGNSYYMNRAILVYDTEHPDLKKDFELADQHGKVHLETRPGKNFFFTSLGKSYLCYKAENQGPLKLWNVAKKQIAGRVDFSDTKFQPFVVRAHGKWGETKRCLPLEIRKMREEFWPFVSACGVVLFSSLLIGAYAVKRTWFTDQKVDYGTYEATGTQEMEMVRQPTEAAQAKAEEAAVASDMANQPEASSSANPFQAKSANPFQQDQANPFH